MRRCDAGIIVSFRACFKECDRLFGLFPEKGSVKRAFARRKARRPEASDFAQKEWGELSMEKNRIRPTAGTKVMRMSYARQKEVLEMPNLLEEIGRAHV